MAVVEKVVVIQRLVQNMRKIHSRFSRPGDSGQSLLSGGQHRFDCSVKPVYKDYRPPLGPENVAVMQRVV